MAKTPKSAVPELIPIPEAAAPEAPKTVKVHCNLPNGLILKLHEERPGLLGTTSFVETERLVLKQGLNEVPAEFVSKWREQNKDSGLLSNGALHLE